MSTANNAAEVIAALAFEQGRMGVDQILAQRPSR